MDVLALRDFYASAPGRTVRRQLARLLAAMEPPPPGALVVGLGYAVPWLDAWRGGGRRVFSLMPGRQGIVHWPEDGPSAAALIDETALPLADASVDLMLAVHALEFAHDVSAVLAEIWRVLTPQGRAVVIVPNRHGLWALSDRTPFGHGRPFTTGQLRTLLSEHQLRVDALTGGLCAPPALARALPAAAALWDGAAQRLGGPFAGLLLATARKEVAGVTPLPTPARARILRPAATLGALRNPCLHDASGCMRNRDPELSKGPTP